MEVRPDPRSGLSDAETDRFQYQNHMFLVCRSIQLDSPGLPKPTNGDFQKISQTAVMLYPGTIFQLIGNKAFLKPGTRDAPRTVSRPPDYESSRGL